MANNVIKRGMDPEWRGGTAPDALSFDIIAASGTYDWFIGSAFVKNAGTVDSAGTSNNSGVTGGVVCIFDANGNPVVNIAKNTSGASIEGTYEPTQRYRLTIDEAATAAVLNQLMNLTAEAGTVGTLSFGSIGNPGTLKSTRQLDFSTAVAVGTQRMMKIVGLTPLFTGNDITVTDAEVWAVINSANYVA